MDYLREAFNNFTDEFWKKLDKENSKISLKDQKIIYSKYFGNIFGNNEK
jgi:hypothetical protein